MPGLSLWKKPGRAEQPRRPLYDLASVLVEQAAANTLWRQRVTFNLIPSETTPSLPVRLLTIMGSLGPLCGAQRNGGLRQ